MYYTCIKDSIRIQESFSLRIIIPGIEVIEAGLRVVVVIPVAEGVDVGHMAGVAGNIVAVAVSNGVLHSSQRPRLKYILMLLRVHVNIF